MSVANSLTPHHAQQVSTYLRFASLQRDQQLKEMGFAFQDFRSSRLLAEDYSNKEVEQIFDALEAIVKKDLSSELHRTAQSAAVCVGQILSQAQDNGLQFKIDASAMEDHREIALMAQMEETRFASLLAPNLESKNVKLPTLVGQQAAELRVMNELKDESQRLRNRLQEMETTALTYLKEKSACQDELDELRSQVAMLKRTIEETKAEAAAAGIALHSLSAQAQDSMAAKGEIKKQAAVLEERLQQKDRELRETEQQLADKVNKASQFQNLQKMLATKNSEVKRLRDLLKKHGISMDTDDALPDA